MDGTAIAEGECFHLCASKLILNCDMGVTDIEQQMVVDPLDVEGGQCRAVGR
ncbi:hypothetical protein D3C85_1721330 [compost metagenome]